jgi:hypothetical protein
MITCSGLAYIWAWIDCESVFVKWIIWTWNSKHGLASLRLGPVYSSSTLQSKGVLLKHNPVSVFIVFWFWDPGNCVWTHWGNFALSWNTFGNFRKCWDTGYGIGYYFQKKAIFKSLDSSNPAQCHNILIKICQIYSTQSLNMHNIHQCAKCATYAIMHWANGNNIQYDSIWKLCKI